MSGSARSGARRLIKELENWRKERKDEKGVERLGPVNEEDLFEWEAVINGRDIGSGYDDSGHVPAGAAEDAVRDADYPSQHCAADGRDLPRPAQGQVDADVQRAAVRAGGAHAAELSRDGQPAQRGRGGAVEGRRRRGDAEAGAILVF
ncbi:ubiquitin-conjugating enzyme e2 4 [Trichoderma arundinaceum]|uniref:Ubiquitin-conjugating enzyme e2 4 n=1 Tax=Trichoderma arundinaceum TaxID=490622 RepID=A0A395NSR6_TRIAR|nr:ubiquitin-conjugating enzyme e2 4 [Trichoderma arundinaceum]